MNDGGRAITVSMLNSYIKNMIDADKTLSSIYIKGEISNLKIHYATQHIYLTLKDSTSLIKAVMFKSTETVQTLSGPSSVTERYSNTTKCTTQEWSDITIPSP